MSEAAYPGPFAPDNPSRRLPWVLAIAVLLVLLGVLGLGRVLHPTVIPRPSVKPEPLQARIYELPASHGAAPTRARSAGLHSVHTQSRHASVEQTHPSSNVVTAHRSSEAAGTFAQSSQTHQARSVPRSQAAPVRKPAIDWANLQSQISSAVSQSEPSLPQFHDPHTLVARYYLASLMEKLQRVGDMNDPTNLTGMPVIRLVIGTHGELLQVALLQSSGSHRLDQDAMQIARESAPFAPFPDRLKQQTHHIELVCYMKFVGYRQLYAGY